MVNQGLKTNSEYFKNKVVLVSGSSMGIGKAIAVDLASQGARVMLNGREEEKLLDTERELSEMGYTVSALRADIADPRQCEALIDETVATFGKLDILVNNAGLSSRGAVEETVASNFKVLIETNYVGTAYLSKCAIAHLKRTQGQLMFINSAGGFRGMPYNAFYTASKMAQSALAQALSIELFDYGIHVGVVYVGFTKNDPRKKILDADGSWVYLPQRTKLSLATPESVAESVRRMIVNRKSKITLTRLGRIADFSIRYLPGISDWILRRNRRKIREQYTQIGGKKVLQVQEGVHT